MRNAKILDIAIIATISALLVAGKWALSILPNIEIVTILVAVFACVWGVRRALASVAIFVVLETLLWGLAPWVLSYLVHWPCVAIVFGFINKISFNNNFVRTFVNVVTVVALTALFGVLTTAVDTLIGYSADAGWWVVVSQFGTRFAVMYARGIVFFATHIISNAVLFAVAFVALRKLFVLTKNKLYSNID